ncbi:MAG: hypothetical protein WCK73_18620 [Deltaproteobacteria bacterium]
MAALLGVAAVVGNVLGVVFLLDVPVAYRPTDIDRWAALSMAQPGATVASAAAFILGLVALAGWAAALGRQVGTPAAHVGASTIAVGALMNAAGCITPIVLVSHVLPGCRDLAACAPTARALLGTTLTLDALFNLLLGLGLLSIAPSLWRGGSRALGALGLVAGLASIPVAGQPFSESAARLLGVAGPLWLLFVLWSSLRLWRSGSTRP